MNRRAQASVDNLRRFLMALPKVQTDEAYALLIGMCMLMAGTALVATPVFAIAYAFHTGESDPLSCTRLDGKRLVVAQFAVVVLRYWCDLSEHEIADAIADTNRDRSRASCVLGKLAPTKSRPWASFVAFG